MQPIRIATCTVSDTRTPEDDAGGKLLRDRLTASSFELADHRIIKDSPDEIRAAVQAAIGEGAHAVVLTGGTGIGPRDVTPEALEPLFDKKLDGFGEAFRSLSWAQVGPRAVLSRATAGVCKGALVFALPGSLKAVELGVDQLVAPLVEHALRMLAGGSHPEHHHAHHAHKKE